MCYERLLTANRSTTLEMKLRLDMSRYKLMSSGSRDGFLILGRMIVCLCNEGNIPYSNDAFAIEAMIGEKTSDIDLISIVCTGSRSHCLPGMHHRIRVTSSTDTTPKPKKCETSLWAILGAGADTVAACIASTLLVKKLLKSMLTSLG